MDLLRVWFVLYDLNLSLDIFTTDYVFLSLRTIPEILYLIKFFYVMRWSYLVGHILTTLILSPFLAWILKFSWNTTKEGVGVNSENLSMFIIVTLYMLFWMFLYFIISLFYCIIPILVYFAVFLILKWLKLDFRIAKGILITTMVLSIIIAFYLINDSTVIDDYMVQVYCGLAIVSGLFFKLKKFEIKNIKS